MEINMSKTKKTKKSNISLTSREDVTKHEEAVHLTIKKSINDSNELLATYERLIKAMDKIQENAELKKIPLFYNQEMHTAGISGEMRKKKFIEDNILSKSRLRISAQNQIKSEEEFVEITINEILKGAEKVVSVMDENNSKIEKAREEILRFREKNNVSSEVVKLK